MCRKKKEKEKRLYDRKPIAAWLSPLISRGSLIIITVMLVCPYDGFSLYLKKKRTKTKKLPLAFRNQVCAELTAVVELELPIRVHAHFDPFERARFHLFEMNDIVAGWTVPVRVEVEIITR